MKRQKKFAGTLKTPIIAAEIDAYLVQALEKLPKLFADYGIAETNNDGSRNDLTLVLALCRDFVPGFAPRHPGGETRGRSGTALSEKYDLLATVASVMDEKSCSASEAVEHLTKRRSLTTPDRPNPWKEKNSKTLKNSFSAAKRDSDVRQLHQHVMGLVQQDESIPEKDGH
jgi:hypothetical protein